ncbi:hypothetical protein BJ973_000359 [Actinoplanes tereljensis]
MLGDIFEVVFAADGVPRAPALMVSVLASSTTC